VTKELARRVNDDGQFCQQISTTEEEACDNVVLIKDKDNSYKKDSKKPALPLAIVTGYPENP